MHYYENDSVNGFIRLTKNLWQYKSTVKRLLQIYMEARRPSECRASPDIQNKASVFPAVISEDPADPQDSNARRVDTQSSRVSDPE